MTNLNALEGQASGEGWKAIPWKAAPAVTEYMFRYESPRTWPDGKFLNKFLNFYLTWFIYS